MAVPFFLTVDTEGDNIWDKPSIITSKNVENLYVFQELCNSYNIKPIYLCNYEAAINPTFQKFAECYKEHLEIGLHLHAWNSPGGNPLTKNDYFHQPYLHEYPKKDVHNKITFLVKLLEDSFQTNIISHRGGRYSISDAIFESLVENGIKIDCSVVPGVNWNSSPGMPNGKGGLDFRKSPRDIHQIFDGIQEIPVSTYTICDVLNQLDENNIFRKIFSKFFQYYNLTLRSKVNNLSELKKVIDWNLARNATHLEYIIHSSELVKNTSHLITSDNEEKLFYGNLKNLFEYINNLDIKPMTFKEHIL